MRRREFLADLKEALENKMGADEIARNMEYYDSYIQSEMDAGKTEEEVMATLGSPLAIAKTILLSSQGEDKSYDAQTKDVSYEENIGVDSEGKRIIRMVVIIAVILIVLSLVFKLFAFAIRFAVPLAVIAFIVYMLKKK